METNKPNKSKVPVPFNRGLPGLEPLPEPSERVTDNPEDLDLEDVLRRGGLSESPEELVVRENSKYKKGNTWIQNTLNVIVVGVLTGLAWFTGDVDENVVNSAVQEKVETAKVDVITATEEVVEQVTEQTREELDEKVKQLNAELGNTFGADIDQMKKDLITAQGTGQHVSVKLNDLEQEISEKDRRIDTLETVANDTLSTLVNASEKDANHDARIRKLEKELDVARQNMQAILLEDKPEPTVTETKKKFRIFRRKEDRP